MDMCTWEEFRSSSTGGCSRLLTLLVVLLVFGHPTCVLVPSIVTTERVFPTRISLDGLGMKKFVPS